MYYIIFKPIVFECMQFFDIITCRLTRRKIVMILWLLFFGSCVLVAVKLPFLIVGMLSPNSQIFTVVQVVTLVILAILLWRGKRAPK